MNVSACLVTRGNVDMQPILDSLPHEWERVLWNNGTGSVKVQSNWRSKIDGYWDDIHTGLGDLSVYGRYAAIEYATHDLIYVADDDVIVSDPQAIVEAWLGSRSIGEEGDPRGTDHVVCNMPPEFRHDFYRDHALVGFGAAFHRDAPRRAFDRYGFNVLMPGVPDIGTWLEGGEVFNRCCDVIFTALTPRVLVDVPKTNLPYAEDADRMYRQPDHIWERERMLYSALQLRTRHA